MGWRGQDKPALTQPEGWEGVWRTFFFKVWTLSKLELTHKEGTSRPEEVGCQNEYRLAELRNDVIPNLILTYV